MKRMTALLLVVTITGVMFSTVQPAAAVGISYFYNFNETVKPFRPIADPLYFVDTETLTFNPSCYDGDSLDNGCAQLFNRHGASFVALMAQFKARLTGVRVEFIARDLHNCQRCAIIVYSGSGKPEGIGSFRKVGPVLSRQWQYYEYDALFPSTDPVVAVGIMNLDNTKEKQVGGIDNLRITLTDN